MDTWIAKLKAIAGSKKQQALFVDSMAHRHHRRVS
jgi:hypothetical protein